MSDVTMAFVGYAVVASLYAGPVGLLSIKPTWEDGDTTAFIASCGLAFSWLGSILVAVVLAVTT